VSGLRSAKKEAKWAYFGGKKFVLHFVRSGKVKNGPISPTTPKTPKKTVPAWSKMAQFRRKHQKTPKNTIKTATANGAFSALL
jgi:hypothetical protein